MAVQQINLVRLLKYLLFFGIFCFYISGRHTGVRNAIVVKQHLLKAPNKTLSVGRTLYNCHLIVRQGATAVTRRNMLTIGFT